MDHGVQAQNGNIFFTNLDKNPHQHAHHFHSLKYHERSRNHSGKTGSVRTMSPPITRSKRTQTEDDPRADPSIDTLLREGRLGHRRASLPILRRATSLESMQDIYPNTDTDASSVSMAPYRPKAVKTKSERYGMRLLGESKPLSHSAHNLRSNYDELDNVQKFSSLRPTKNVSFGAADQRIHGVKEVYFRDELQITVADPESIGRSMATYTRRPGLERAARIARRSNRPASATELPLPPARATTSLRSSNSFNYQSHPPVPTYQEAVNLASSAPNIAVSRAASARAAASRPAANAPRPAANAPRSAANEYSTAPVDAFASLERKANITKAWDVRKQVESLRADYDSTDNESTTDAESDIIYTGTLTLHHNKNGGLQQAGKMVTKTVASNVHAAPPSSGSLNRQGNSGLQWSHEVSFQI